MTEFWRETTYLLRQGASGQIVERELEFAGASLYEHFDGDQSVGVDGLVGNSSHDGSRHRAAARRAAISLARRFDR